MSIKLTTALVLCTQAAKLTQRQEGDVFGPNGQNYKNLNAGYDLSRIGIDVKTPGQGDKCRPGDWASVHYTASLEDGRVVSDSRAEPGGRPLHFTLGDHQVFSCFDIALPQLSEGATATLHCPSFYAWGAAYTQAPLGGEPIPLHSDVDFQIDVVECNRVPARAQMAQGFQIHNANGYLYTDDGQNKYAALADIANVQQTMFQFVEGTNHIEPVWFKSEYPEGWEMAAGMYSLQFFPETKELKQDYMNMGMLSYACAYPLSSSTVGWLSTSSDKANLVQNGYSCDWQTS